MPTSIFLTELWKYPRSRFVIIVLALIAFESAWVFSALTVALSRPTEVDKSVLYALVPASQIHSLLAPIVLTVLASKLATLEHDARAFKTLFANGVDPHTLFFSKSLVLFICNTLISAAHCLTIYAAMTEQGINTDSLYLTLYFLVILIGGIATSSIQLYFALSYEKQQVTLFIGGFGAFIGSMTLFVPKLLALFLPWQYFGLLSPAKPTFVEGTMVDLSFTPNYALLVGFVLLVGLGLTPALAEAFKRNILK